MLSKYMVQSLRDLALEQLPGTKALSKKLYIEHGNSRAALQAVAWAPTLLINSPLSTSLEVLAGRLLALVGQHPCTHTEYLIDKMDGDDGLSISVENAALWAEQDRSYIEEALLETARQLCDISGANLPPWMNVPNGQFAPQQSPATPAPVVAREFRIGNVLTLPNGHTHVPAGELPLLIADAQWPDDGTDDEGWEINHGTCEINLETKVKQAVQSGSLPVRNPSNFEPLTYLNGNAWKTGLVTVADLQIFLAELGMTLSTAGALEAQASTPSPAPVAADGDAPAKRSNRKPSWATVAMPYMKSLFTAGHYKSASMFYKALRHRAGESDSPFKLVNRELYCTEAGTTVSDGSLGNVWPQIRAL